MPPEIVAATLDTQNLGVYGLCLCHLLEQEYIYLMMVLTLCFGFRELTLISQTGKWDFGLYSWCQNKIRLLRWTLEQVEIWEWSILNCEEARVGCYALNIVCPSPNQSLLLACDSAEGGDAIRG